MKYNFLIIGLEDINECLHEDTICPAHSHCVNYAGYFSCKCNDNFEPVYKPNKISLILCKRKVYLFIKLLKSMNCLFLAIIKRISLETSNCSQCETFLNCSCIKNQNIKIEGK